MIKAIKVGQNVIDYATGREMPADKLTVREMHNFKADAPKRGAFGSPSSSTPATGTSPPRPSPT